MLKKLSHVFILLCLSISSAQAAADFAAVSYPIPADILAVKLTQQLTERHFKVVDNLNVLPRIHKGNPQLAAQIPSQIQGERLLVVCQSRSIVGYLRTEPAATSLCPLTLSLVQVDGKTTAYYLQRAPLLAGKAAAQSIGQQADEGVLAALHAVQK
jgi:hypothetical protein